MNEPKLPLPPDATSGLEPRKPLSEHSQIIVNALVKLLSEADAGRLLIQAKLKNYKPSEFRHLTELTVQVSMFPFLTSLEGFDPARITSVHLAMPDGWVRACNICNSMTNLHSDEVKTICETCRMDSR